MLIVIIGLIPQQKELITKHGTVLVPSYHMSCTIIVKYACRNLWSAANYSYSSYSYPTKNTLAVKKVVAKTWKGLWWKRCEIKRGRPRNAVDHIKNFDNNEPQVPQNIDVKSKGGSQGLCRNAVDHIKIFDNNEP